MKILNLGLDKPRHYFPSDEVVNVDIWKPYLLGWHGHRILADVRFLPIREKSFDMVVSVDLLEHIPKEDGKKLIEQVEKIARKNILLTTPVYFFEQSPLDGNPYQKHLSLYEKLDFGGYEFMRVPNAGLYFKVLSSGN